MMKHLLLFLFVLLFPVILFAQNEWIVPVTDTGKISPYIFEEEMVTTGEVLYENVCTSCHGVPTKNNPMPFAPSPGDPASDKFQGQTDGSMFYKITNGRGGMPSFANSLAEEEIWSLIAFIRSFNKTYEQPKFDYGDEILVDLDLSLSFDENVNKLVIKVTSDGELKEGIQVSSWVVGLFGKYMLGKDTTNKMGIAYFDVDPLFPGDETGNLQVQVRAQKGYSIKKTNQKMKLVNPSVKTNLLEGRHLWSIALKAPIWLIVVFNLIVVGIWSIIVYIVVGLLWLKRIK